MNFQKLIGISLCSCILFFACKKSSKSTDGYTQPDFNLEQLDVDYPVGTSWVYRIDSKITTQYLTVQMQPMVQVNPTSTYTVKVMYDTLLPGNTQGKVLQYFLSPSFNGTLKELQFVNSLGEWNQVLFGSSGSASITPSGFIAPLPLTASNKWKNTYYPAQSNLDTCYSLGYDFVEVYPANIKCLHFMARDKANSNISNYWYNKSAGLVKSTTSSASFPDPSRMVTQASTITLSFQ